MSRRSQAASKGNNDRANASRIEIIVCALNVRPLFLVVIVVIESGIRLAEWMAKRQRVRISAVSDVASFWISLPVQYVSKLERIGRYRKGSVCCKLELDSVGRGDCNVQSSIYAGLSRSRQSLKRALVNCRKRRVSPCL